MSAPRWFDYEWTRNGVLIPGAQYSSYTLQPEDVGKSIGCNVVGGNYAGETRVTAPQLVHGLSPQLKGTLVATEGDSKAVFVVNRPSLYTTFDPANTRSVCALSNGNLTVQRTATGSSDQISTRSVLSQASGKLYCEFVANTVSVVDDTAVGITTAKANANSYLGNTGSAGYLTARVTGNGAVWVNGVRKSTTIGTFITGNTIGMAVDIPNRRIWWRCNKQSNLWNNSSTANPATGAGAISLTGLSVPFFVAVECYSLNDKFTAVFGPSFSLPMPSGFSPWAS